MATANNILIESNLIFDEDLGVIRFIRSNLADDTVFNIDVLSLPDESIIGLLQQRSNKNPLSVITLDTIDQDSVDTLYGQIMDEYAGTILREYTPITPVMNFLLSCVESGEILGSIICEPYQDFKYIKKVIANESKLRIPVFVKPIDNKANINEFDSIYLKYTDNVHSYIPVVRKNLYVADLNCNLESELMDQKIKIPKMDMVIEFSESNEILTMSMYEYTEKNYPVG